MSKTQQLFEYDLGFKKQVSGCDEAGRGPLAGPLVCVAVTMPLDHMIDGINDSKKLSSTKRESLYEQILSRAISCKISIINHDIIDKINILNATKTGMKEVVSQLNNTELVLVDAVKTDFDKEFLPIIKGDATSYNIASASIIAKVTRDRLMCQLHKIYPQYNFSKNKGYGTKEHIDALKEIGASEVHRKTFISKILGQQS